MKKRKDGLYEKVVTINGIKVHFYADSPKKLADKIKKAEQSARSAYLLTDIADRWFEWKAPQVRYKTAEGYISPIKDIKSYFGGRIIGEVNSKDITNFIRSVEKRGCSRRTVQTRLDVLNMIYKYAVAELGIVESNPAAEVSLSRGLPVSRRQPPTEAEAEAIKAHADDDRFSLLPFFLANTGLRLGEALALTDSSFTNDQIIVAQQAQWQPNKAVLSPLKTENGYRAVPITNELKSHLPQFSGYLFSVDGSRPYTKIEYRKRMAKYSTQNGVNCTAHQLRHLFATTLYNAKIDTKIAATIMGHDEAVMRKIYTHISEQNLRDAAQQLDNYIAHKDALSTEKTYSVVRKKPEKH